MRALFTALAVGLAGLTAACDAKKVNSRPLPAAKVEIKDVKEGTGAAAKPGDVLELHYTGTLEDGTQFDSSRDRGQTLSIRLGKSTVIDGWHQGLEGLKVGGRRTLTIPPELGYGSRRKGKIPPDSTLIFDVELISLNEKEPDL
jgi:peptidylprolyl isomerase